MRQPSRLVSVLDNEPAILHAVSRLLRSAGWSVAGFSDPFAFLDHAASQVLRVALIDICMPVMDGLQVLARLQKLSPATNVIFLTGRDDPSTRERALAAGAFAFLLKPADGHEILSVLESAHEGSGPLSHP